jgi:hypothetical protein
VNIDEVSMSMAQDKVAAEAAMRVQAMALERAEVQAAALMKLMESTKAIGDPAMGNRIDLLA